MAGQAPESPLPQRSVSQGLPEFLAMAAVLLILIVLFATSLSQSDNPPEIAPGATRPVEQPAVDQN